MKHRIPHGVAGDFPNVFIELHKNKRTYCRKSVAAMSKKSQIP